MVYLAAVAAVYLATLARDPGAVEWDGVAAWVYIALFIALFALAVRGIQKAAAPPRTS